MNDVVDLLQIKINKAMRELPEDTQNAIASVDWRAAILGLREKRGYSFEQLGELELETELLLCGLSSAKDYPKELEKRMKIPKMTAEELVNEMNDLVFRKIREELIKITERKRTFARKQAEEKNSEEVLNTAGINIVPVPLSDKEKPAENAENREQILRKIEQPEKGMPSILAQKLSSSVKNETIKTEHTLENITKVNTPTHENTKAKVQNVDPYREIPE